MPDLRVAGFHRLIHVDTNNAMIQRRIRSASIGVLARSICLSSLMLIASQGYSLDLPQIRDDVVMEKLGMLRKVATAEVERLSGKRVAVGQPIPYTDPEGNLLALDFVFRVDAASFPSESEIRAVISEGRKLFADPVRGRREKERKGHVGDPGAKGHGRNLSEAERLAWGIDSYWTITVSVSEEEAPVREICGCLPRYYTQGDILEQIASKALGSGSPRLKRIIYLSQVDIVYDFEDSGRSVLVDAFRMKTVDRETLRRVRKKAGTKQNRAVQEEWTRLKRQANVQ